MGNIDKMIGTNETNNHQLRIVIGDLTFGIHGTDFHYIFSYETGGMESLVIQDREWLYRSPKPTFWRALTDNDRGNRFHLQSGMWLAADQFISCKEICIEVDGEEIKARLAPQNNVFRTDLYAKEAKITYLYETLTIPTTYVEVSYMINTEGEIRVHVTYQGQAELPELPVFGMRFIMPTVANKYIYQGLSGETYPDRKWGGEYGIHEIQGLPVTPYMRPQECGMHVETDWVKVYRDSALDNRKKQVEMTAIEIHKVDKPFAFSCLPYTSLELENATHQEELPSPKRTVLCVMGAVRGVGGIDSWGADVEQAYHIDATKNINYTFVIKREKN